MFNAARQPLVPAFLTLVVLVVVALCCAAGYTVPATENATEGLVIPYPGDLIGRMQHSWPLLSRFVAALLLIAAGLRTGRMAMRYNLYTVSSCLPLPLLGIVACCGVLSEEYLAGSAAALVMAQAMRNFGRSFRNGYSFDAIFGAAFNLGLLLLITAGAAPMVLLLPVAIILFRRNRREAIVGVIGVLLAPATLCYMNWGLGGDFTAPVADIVHRTGDGGLLALCRSVSPLQLALPAIVALLAIGSMLIFLTDRYSTGTKSRFVLIFCGYALAIGLMSLALPAARIADTMLMALPAALLIPILFVRLNRTITLLLYIALIAASVVGAVWA